MAESDSDKSNIDLFNEVAAIVLERLYGSFPVGVNLQPEIVLNDPSREAANFFYYTVIFLGKEGLLGYEMAADDGSFFDVALTSKGLAALDSTPDVLDERKESYRQRISTALKAGSKEVLKTAMQQFIAAVASGRIHLPV
jgi:hypothetical protein